ncbi:MAG: AMP-binding protein [Pseudomonadota bacterium]
MTPLPDTIGAALRRSARNHPDRIAVVGDGQRLSFRSLDERADHLALGLQALGIGPGDHVALLMTNDPEWVLAWMATLRLGAVRCWCRSTRATSGRRSSTSCASRMRSC